MYDRAALRDIKQQVPAVKKREQVKSESHIIHVRIELLIKIKTYKSGNEFIKQKKKLYKKQSKLHVPRLDGIAGVQVPKVHAKLFCVC